MNILHSDPMLHELRLESGRQVDTVITAAPVLQKRPPEGIVFLLRFLENITAGINGRSDAYYQCARRDPVMSLQGIHHFTGKIGQ